MAYSIDLRERVVAFVRSGGSKAEAARRFGVSIWCVFDWLKRNDLKPRKVEGRRRKLDLDLLAQHVERYPDAVLRERAEHFGVHTSAIWFALRRLKHYRRRGRDHR